MKKNKLTSILLLSILAIIFACGNANNEQKLPEQKDSLKIQLADTLEKSLFTELLDKYYPRNIDSINGGFVSEYNNDWTLTKSEQIRSLVQQARHTWATAFIYQNYPNKKEFLQYSLHGFKFLKDRMWDSIDGGFYSYCLGNGSQIPNDKQFKQTYGQVFAIYGISLYYKVSNDPLALDLAKKSFLWLEKNAHDKKYGGYFDILDKKGQPIMPGKTNTKDKPAAGLKDFNSTIHIMEGFTQLYLVWPDSLVRKRLEEIFYLVRDTFIQPEGYLELYFHPDWTLVTEDEMLKSSDKSPYFKKHFTYGHDVETAYLLLETAEALGMGADKKTNQIAKLLVDHSLESGWDSINGGFFDGGKLIDGKITIIDNRKCWWGQVEGLNALLIMQELYPNDKNDYYGKFTKHWNYINKYLIDKEYGDWYNYGLDTYPESKKEMKSHIWKATYHNARGLVHCINRLRKMGN